MRLSTYIRCFVFSSLALLSIPASAQHEAAAPVEYPTQVTLTATTIPARDRLALARDLLGVVDIAPAPVSAPQRQIGERQTFNATNSTEDRAIQVDAVLRAIGEHIYLWVEDGAQVADSDLEALVKAFDERIYPGARALWGSEETPGIDGDPRIYGLLAHGLGAGTAAYFVSEHTYPVEAVSTSNEHEMFFFNLDILGANMDVRYVESIVAHEFQHMIRHRIQPNEEYWINEGFSDFTQMYVYNDVPVWQVASFLYQPGTQLNAWAEDFAQRSQNYGAALLFTTYFYDRYGLDALQDLSNDPASRALDSVERVLRNRGEPGANDFFADWVLANWVFDTRIGDGIYGYASIANGIVHAAPLQTATTYPYTRQHTVNQYATDYYVLTNFGDAGSLDIEVSAPVTVPLVPVQAHSGQRMWYSNKADMSSTTLTRAFDLSGVERATLKYHVWFHTEQFWDFGYVMASGDGGKTWDILPTAHTTIENPHNTAYGAGYTGESGVWLEEAISLDKYAGGEVLVRFQMITDDAVTQPGMVIDDVGIPEIGYSDDFESGPGGWQAEGWLWMDNILPQQVWVQTVQQIGTHAAVSRWQVPLESSWTLPLEQGVEDVMLAISPYAPVTTVPMDYTLEVSLR